MRRTCVVTGAASGIGRATLSRFSADGCRCVGIDSDPDAIADAVAEFGWNGSRHVRFVRADLTSEDPIDLGDIDAPALTLVNNLGGSRGAVALEDSDWDDFLDALAFNLRPLHALTRTCLPALRKATDARIVNVSSVSARRRVESVGAGYAAAKAAVIGASRHLAAELAGDGIVVNTVCPGVIDTERIRGRRDTWPDGTYRRLLDDIPLSRLGIAGEVAEAIYFFGATASYVTGAILDVNGGMYMP